MATATSTAPADTWFAEPEGDGFWRVVDHNGVILARHCLPEDAFLFAAAPSLLSACQGLLLDPQLYGHPAQVYGEQRAASSAHGPRARGNFFRPASRRRDTNSGTSVLRNQLGWWVPR